MDVRKHAVVLMILAAWLGACAPTRPGPSNRLEGTVFFDANLNARRDPGEAGIPDRMVYLYGGRDDSTATGPGGDYSFSALPDGFYLVLQGFSSTWRHTSPAGARRESRSYRPYKVALFRHFSRVASDAYAYYGMRGTFSGYSVPNHLVTKGLGRISSNPLAPQEIFAHSIYDSFVATVCEDGSLLTDPPWVYGTGAHLVGLSSWSPERTGIDFGTSPTHIAGRVVLNGRDSAKGLKGWTVHLEGTTEMRVMTDSLGYYRFRDFDWGHYTVSLDVPEGYDLTAPSTIALPDEEMLNVRTQIQRHLSDIFERANVHFAWHQGMNATGYTGFELSSELLEDRVAEYEVLRTRRDSLVVRAISKNGLGSIVAESGPFQMNLKVVESPAFAGSGRAGRGSWPVSILEGTGWRGDYTWVDLGAAPLVSIAGAVEGRTSDGKRGDGRSLEGREATVYFSGPSVDSAAVEPTGAYTSPVLRPGAYAVTAAAKWDPRAGSLSVGDSARQRRAMLDHLNACFHQLSLVAADAFRFRIQETRWGGGGGIYRGYRPGPGLEVNGRAVTAVSANATSVYVTVMSVGGFGSVGACLDERGLLHDVVVDGEFLALHPAIVLADGPESHRKGVNVTVAFDW